MAEAEEAAAPLRERDAMGKDTEADGPVVVARDACAPAARGGRAFEFATFSAFTGEVCALLASEGDRTAAVLMAVAGLGAVESGSLAVCGVELVRPARHRIRRTEGFPRGTVGLSVVTGRFDVAREATVGEAVSHEFALWRRSAEDDRDVLDYLAAFELATDVDRRVSALAAPARARLSAALALACRPAVAAIDLTDPFASGLSATEGEALVRLLSRLARTQPCAVVVGVTDERVARAADRAFALDMTASEALGAASARPASAKEDDVR